MELTFIKKKLVSKSAPKLLMFPQTPNCAHRERKKIERTSPASWAGKNMS